MSAYDRRAGGNGRTAVVLLGAVLLLGAMPGAASGATSSDTPAAPDAAASGTADNGIADHGIADHSMADHGMASSDDKAIVAVIDRARLVRVPAGTETLVIGNPTIADVTMLRQKNLMVLTPKAFGETNFIALDDQGNPVAESTIRVIAGGNALVVQRGMERESYSCAPRCQPVERLGDDEKYRKMVAAQSEDHFQRLTGTTTSTPIPRAP